MVLQRAVLLQQRLTTRIAIRNRVLPGSTLDRRERTQNLNSPGNAGFSGTGGEQRNGAKAKRIRETDRYEKIQRQMEEKRRGEERGEEDEEEEEKGREQERRGEENG
uniref:Uncharacterized protein n=1 Tax=Vespula pensylvanica TaxID=30213 RepID=A0A834PCZ6_VESPE|nr:hypothetical protein H0235_004033 [Vespula pensylvanica]